MKEREEGTGLERAEWSEERARKNTVWKRRRRIVVEVALPHTIRGQPESENHYEAVFQNQ